VVRVVELFDEQVPEPGLFQVELGEVLHELLGHPFGHELLERARPRADRGEVLHGGSAQREEQPPAPPPHLVDEVLSPLARAVLQQRPQHGVADLGVACLIGLDARHRLLEQVMVGAVGHGRHGHELQVGEARLEHEVELDR
jgi:hypothetical protein